jgi:hypothetical protein
MIIGGNFNASIGTADKTEDLFSRSPVYRHGNPQRNESGKKLRDFMNLHELCSVATFFEKKNHNTWSFNGDGLTAHQIDHILVKRKELKRFSNCDTIAGAESGHTADAAIMQIASFIPRKQNHRQAGSQGNETPDNKEKKKKKATPIDWEEIRLDSSTVNNFNDAIDKRIDEEL